MESLRFEEARPAAVRAMIERAPVAYVPVGALEWHGEHLPLGLDGLKAHGLCAAAAARTGGVVFPPVFWGAADTLPFPFTLSFRRSVVRGLVRKTIAQLAGMGFRVVVLLTGHYPPALVKALRSECRRACRAHVALALGAPETVFTLPIRYYGDHAGRWETAVMLALRPELVDLSAAPEGLSTLERQSRAGTMGQDPRRATVEDGARAVELVAAGLAAAVESALRDGTDAAFEKLYTDYAAALRPSLNNRLGWDLAREALDVRSVSELLRYWLWTLKNL